MTEVTYRAATADDLANVADFESGIRAAETLAAHEAGKVFYAIAVRDGEVVASEVLDYEGTEWQPEIRNLYVRKTARRQGVGLALHEYLEGVARNAGFEEVFVAGPTDNAAATAMFISQDYLPTGTQRSTEYTWTDAEGVTHEATQVEVIYRKSLTLR